MTLLPIALAVLLNAAPAQKSVTAGKITAAMKASRKANWGPSKHYQEYASLFVANGRRWKVDPVIIACVAYAESRYNVEAPRLMRRRCVRGVCKMVWINNQEAGMMQVDNRGDLAKNGYKACTGKTLTGNRRLRMLKLRPPAIAICVGARALSVFKRWGRRKRPHRQRNKRFFANYPGLMQHF